MSDLPTDEAGRLAVLIHRMTMAEHKVVSMDGKMDLLLADKARRDGAIAAGNWISRALWALLGGLGMWFVENKQ